MCIFIIIIITWRCSAVGVPRSWTTGPGRSMRLRWSTTTRFLRRIRGVSVKTNSIRIQYVFVVSKIINMTFEVVIIIIVIIINLQHHYRCTFVTEIAMKRRCRRHVQRTLRRMDLRDELKRNKTQLICGKTWLQWEKNITRNNTIRVRIKRRKNVKHTNLFR